MKRTESMLSPMLMAVLASRFDGVVREMTNTMLRTGRSTVINSGRDFPAELLRQITNYLRLLRACQFILTVLILSLIHI